MRQLLAELTPAQADGVACCVCGDEHKPMYPVPVETLVQLFICGDCAVPEAMARELAQDWSEW